MLLDQPNSLLSSPGTGAACLTGSPRTEAKDNSAQPSCRLRLSGNDHFHPDGGMFPCCAADWQLRNIVGRLADNSHVHCLGRLADYLRSSSIFSTRASHAPGPLSQDEVDAVCYLLHVHLRWELLLACVLREYSVDTPPTCAHTDNNPLASRMVSSRQRLLSTAISSSHATIRCPSHHRDLRLRCTRWQDQSIPAVDDPIVGPSDHRGRSAIDMAAERVHVQIGRLPDHCRTRRR